MFLAKASKTVQVYPMIKKKKATSCEEKQKTKGATAVVIHLFFNRAVGVSSWLISFPDLRLDPSWRQVGSKLAPS